MQYVSSLRMEYANTLSGLDKLLRSITGYLDMHPPPSQADLDGAMQAAARLGNQKLLDKCRTAQERCLVGNLGVEMLSFVFCYKLLL